MDRLALFIPLAKADAAQRLVYGEFDESVDRSGEVFDYATSKPLIQAWSDEIAKASDGKSFGNIRAQHGRNACGKLVDISFDDDLKKVGFVAKIVDDDEWKKVEEGVYTGFSPGGRYAKRWQDGAVKRYTADVRELSIVDVPCNRNATFTLIKADGVEEQIGFTLAKAYEPGNEATVARAEELAKAAGKPDKRNDFVAKARAELIAENADEALAKMADEPEAPARVDPAAALQAALEKGNAIGAPTAEAGPFDDLAKAAAALRLLKSDNPLLSKGLCTISWVANLMEQFASLQGSLAIEAGLEGDGSPLPDAAKAIVQQIGALLVGMAQEEVAECIEALTGGDVEVTPIDDVPVMALASQIVDMVKADEALMEKAGARNSKADQEKIQTMHDHSVALGANCGTAEKDALATITADRDRMAKALEDSVPAVEALTDKLEKAHADKATAEADLAKAQARVAELEALPEAPKGPLIAMEKAAPPVAAEPKSLVEQIADLPPGRAKAAAILASVGSSRN